MSIEDGLGDGGPAPAADEMFAVTAYEQRQPAPRGFMAWHKPRKQLVREELWGSEIEWLLSQKAPGDHSFRYVGLPGADLLDLRYLYQRFCNDGHYKMTFLGFDESALPGSPNGDALNISLQEVRGLANVEPISEVLGDDFRRIADRNSIAWDFVQRLGPFDAINVDLCNHLGHDEPAIDFSIYHAIHSLCGLQNRRSRPWSLFLTSRINRENVAAAALDRFMLALERNLGNCRGFSDALSANSGVTDVTPAAIALWSDAVFFRTMTIAISKWLLGLSQSMSCRFSVSQSVAYRVWGPAAHEDMASMVFRFEPVASIARDPAGLATAVPAWPDECTQATPIPAALARMVNIDKELAEQPILWEYFTQKTAELLQQARYDPDSYRLWAEQHR